MATRTETHPLTDQVSKSAYESLEKMSDSAGHAEERLRDTAYKAQNNLKTAAKKVQENTREVTNSMAGYIQEHPFTTVGIAAGIGLVIGALLRRP